MSLYPLNLPRPLIRALHKIAFFLNYTNFERDLENLNRRNVTPAVNLVIKCCSPFFALISLFPVSRVMLALPLRTMSIMVFHALGDKRSEGETKFPAALFTITFGKPNFSSILSITPLTASGSRMSQGKGRT